MYKSMVKSKKFIIFILSVGIVLFLALIFAANLFHFNYAMESDAASEAILCVEIWKSKEIVPSTWYPSTEARIISTPNLGALFYGISKNMSFAMGAACCVMTLLVLCSLFYFFKSLKLPRHIVFGGGYLFLALPAGVNALKLLYLYAGYYAICVIILFFTLGVYGKLLKVRKIVWGELTVAVLMALGLGFQGMRGLLVIYAPLFGIELIRKLYCLHRKMKFDKTENVITVWTVILLSVNYLGTAFPFSVGQNISKNIRRGFSKLLTVVIPDIGKSVGIYQYNYMGKICVILLLVLTAIMCVNILYRILTAKDITPVEWCYLVVCSSPVITALIVSFTTVESSERYYFMLVFAMALTVILLGQKGGIGIKLVLLGAVIILSVTNIYQIYVPILKSEEPVDTEAYRVVSFLEENDCFAAYATFENANMMTVLSNGRVRVAPVASLSQMDICKWLSSKDWYPPNVPLGQRTAYIVTEAEQQEFLVFLNDKAENVKEMKQIGKYKIFISDFNYANLGIDE